MGVAIDTKGAPSSARPAAQPPACSTVRRAIILLGHARLVGFGHVPEDDVVMGLFHSWVASVVIHVDVVDSAPGGLQIVKLLLPLEVLDRDHVDRADELAVVVIGEEGA